VTGPEDDDPGDDGPEPGPAGHVRSTTPGVVVGWGVAGLVLGWVLHPAAVAVKGTAPTVGWLPVGTLVFVAVVVGSTAWTTHRQLHRRHERLAPHHAVNRLVLAKSCAIVGSLVAGGYFGYALSWLGLTDAELARQRLVHAVVGGVAGLALVTGSLLLERACRVSDDR